jgi:GNAT superfamily N-acetyltransferase
LDGQVAGREKVLKTVNRKLPPAVIERLTVGDGDRLRAIRLRALRDAPKAFAATLDETAARPLDTWNRQLEQLATFVATVNIHDIGLVRGSPHDHLADAAYLVSMWVAPEARRRGIGLALVDAVVNWARTQGHGRLLLDVGEQNAPAIALYERAGFVSSGQMSTLQSHRGPIREIQFVLEL